MKHLRGGPNEYIKQIGGLIEVVVEGESESAQGHEQGTIEEDPAAGQPVVRYMSIDRAVRGDE